MVSFFSLPLWILRKNRARQKKLIDFNSRLRRGAQCPWFTECTYYFLISNCGSASNFLKWIQWLLEFIQLQTQKVYKRQIIIFYNPSNALCPSDESLRIKHFKHYNFIGKCPLFTWFNLQILNFLLMKTHRVLNRSSKRADVRYCKHKVFLYF